MTRPRSTIAFGLALALAGVALTGTAGAKVSCERGGHGGALWELPGVPATPEAGQTYEVTIDLPNRNAANPEPLLMVLRCDDPSASAGSEQFSGVAGPGGATRFDVRFSEPGRYRVATMTVGGNFRDHGFYEVRAPAAAASDREPADDEPALTTAMAGVAGAAGIAGLAFVLWHRRRDRPPTGANAS